MLVDREAVRQVALEIADARGSVAASELREAAGCTTQLSAAVLKELCKAKCLERRVDREAGQKLFRYYPVDIAPPPPTHSPLGAALVDLCDPNSNPDFSMGVEMNLEEKSDLRIDLLSLRERLTLDALEDGYCFGIKYALDEQDWISVQAHLERFEAHLKEKHDRVHKLLVRVRRQNRRK